MNCCPCVSEDHYLYQVVDLDEYLVTFGTTFDKISGVNDEKTINDIFANEPNAIRRAELITEFKKRQRHPNNGIVYCFISVHWFPFHVLTSFPAL